MRARRARRLDQADETGLSYRRNRYHDGLSGQFTQEVGIAGGLNLYGYANGDPINFSDPFGLYACCNLTKLGVGVVNLYRAGAVFFAGSGNLVAGGPEAVLGAHQVAVFGPGTLTRGLIQIRESISEDVGDAHYRNLLGLAPYGQHFDDPHEPDPFEYAGQLREHLHETGIGGLIRRLMNDYFSPPDPNNQ